MKVEHNPLIQNPAAAAPEVKQEVSVDVLDNTLDMAAEQASQLIKMMEIKDPMVGQMVDIEV